MGSGAGPCKSLYHAPAPDTFLALRHVLVRCLLFRLLLRVKDPPRTSGRALHTLSPAAGGCCARHGGIIGIFSERERKRVDFAVVPCSAVDLPCVRDLVPVGMALVVCSTIHTLQSGAALCMRWNIDRVHVVFIINC